MDEAKAKVKRNPRGDAAQAGGIACGADLHWKGPLLQSAPCT